MKAIASILERTVSYYLEHQLKSDIWNNYLYKCRFKPIVLCHSPNWITRWICTDRFVAWQAGFYFTNSCIIQPLSECTQTQTLWAYCMHKSVHLEQGLLMNMFWAGDFFQQWKSLLLIDASNPSAMGEYRTLFDWS